MSFKPSKKLVVKRATASSSSDDKDGHTELTPPDHTVGRSRKLFFSFKSSNKPSRSNTASGHEQQEPCNTTQFPSIGSQDHTQTDSAPQLPIPIRNIRSSILFSQQFNFDQPNVPDEPIQHNPATIARPQRSANRPVSRMILQDGTFNQIQSGPQIDQRSPESFYTKSDPNNRVDSIDDDNCSHTSATSWNPKPSSQPQPASNLIDVLAGYQVQSQSHAPTIAMSSAPPGQLQEPIEIRPQASSLPPLRSPMPNARVPLSAPNKCSNYSPLAAFLGQSNSTNHPAPTIPSLASSGSQNASASPGSLLSAFLGSRPDQSKEAQSLEKRSTGYSEDLKCKVSNEVSHNTPKTPSESSPPLKSAQLTEQDSPVSDPIASDPNPLPTSQSLSPSLSLGKLEEKEPVNCDSIPSTAAPETLLEKVPAKDQPKLETISPSAIPVPNTPAPSISPSPWSTPCHTPSSPGTSILESHQHSQSSAESPTLDLGESRSFKRYESRKRSVEKVYLDSSSQHSSSISEECLSPNGLSAASNRKPRAISLESDGESTGPNSNSSSKGPLEAIESHQKEALNRNEGETPQENIVSRDGSNAKAIEPPGEDKAAHKANDEVSEAEEDADADADAPTINQPSIGFDQILLSHPIIFSQIIGQLEYLDFFSLSQISKEFQEEIEDDPRLMETVLKRYLSGFGYRSLSPRSKQQYRKKELPIITLADVANFYAGLEFDSLEYIEYAKLALKGQGLNYRTAKMIRCSTRAYNKLVAYIRTIEEIEPSLVKQKPGHHRHAGRSFEPVYRSGRAPVFRVWVPSADHWMTNEELSECERELWRSQVWSHLKKGDVCWNLAIGDFGNEGKLLFDGRFLRDLLFEFDEVGHLPSWLNMLEFPPSYFHKIISSSSSTPIFYLDLSNFKDEIRKTLKLCEDKVEVASPQARYRVQRWVYRSIIQISKGEWSGCVVIEVDGTTEHAQDLLKRCCGKGSSSHLTPWRIIREKSRPGKIWIRPVTQERLT